MFVKNNRKTTRFLVPWSLHRFKNHNLFTYPNISQSTLTVSINAVSQYDVQFVIFWKCLKFKNTTNQRLTSNFFLSHYVHNNISTDIFATKIRSRWSIEFYAKSSQRRHSALASELFLLRINLFYHTSLWDVWREKMGNKKKYIYIYIRIQSAITHRIGRNFSYAQLSTESTSSRWVSYQKFQRDSDESLFSHRINR